jgi:hypothetical protein
LSAAGLVHFFPDLLAKNSLVIFHWAKLLSLASGFDFLPDPLGKNSIVGRGLDAPLHLPFRS